VFSLCPLCELDLLFSNPGIFLCVLSVYSVPSVRAISFVLIRAFFLCVLSAPSVRTSFYVFGSVFSVRTEFFVFNPGIFLCVLSVYSVFSVRTSFLCFWLCVLCANWLLCFSIRALFSAFSLRPPCSLCEPYLLFLIRAFFLCVLSAPSVRTSFYVFGSVFSVRTEFFVFNPGIFLCVLSVYSVFSVRAISFVFNPGIFSLCSLCALRVLCAN